MIHYYCFIENGGKLIPDSKVFKVAVGDGQRDQVKKCLVDCYATDTGGFFRIWDDTTDFHLSQMATYRPADLLTQNLGLNVVKTDIRTLYRNLIDGSLDTLENPPHVIRNAFKLKSILSPTFFVNKIGRQAKSVLPAGRRKNLSVRPTPEDHIAAIGFALMALLYWLGSLIGCIEKAVL